MISLELAKKLNYKSMYNLQIIYHQLNFIKKILNKVRFKQKANKIRLKLFSHPKTKSFFLNKYSRSKIGSYGWLIYTELKYGGIATNVKRKKVSVYDPRSKEQILKLLFCLVGRKRNQ